MYNQNRPSMQQYSPQMRMQALPQTAQPGMVHVQNYNVHGAPPAQQMQYQQMHYQQVSPVSQQVGGGMLMQQQHPIMLPVQSGGGAMNVTAMHVSPDQGMRSGQQAQFQGYQLQTQQQTTQQLHAVAQPQMPIQKFPSYQQANIPRMLQAPPAPTQAVMPRQLPSAPGPSSSSLREPSPQSSSTSDSINLTEAPVRTSIPDVQPHRTAAVKRPAPETALEDPTEMLTMKTLDDLVQQVDKYVQLDQDVKEVLLNLADNFIENVARGACQIAKHRKSAALDAKDVQLCLEKNWNIWLPGFGSEDPKPYKKSSAAESHVQRMAIIKKRLKKMT